MKFGRPVVHADVDEDPANPAMLRATYSIDGVTRTSPNFPRKSFGYARVVKRDVQQYLGSVQKHVVLVKVWRAEAARESPLLEKVLARGVAGALGIVASFALIVAIVLNLIGLDSEALTPAIPVLLVTNVALSGMTAAGIILYRALARRSEPLETTTGWTMVRLGPVVIVLAVSLLLLNNAIPDWETPQIRAFLTMAGLIVSIVGAFLSSYWNTWRWTAVEEIQRQNRIARDVVDHFEFRNPV